MDLFICSTDAETIHQHFENGLIKNVDLSSTQFSDIPSMEAVLKPILREGYRFRHIIVKLPSLSYGDIPVDFNTVAKLVEEAKTISKLSRSITFQIPYSPLGIKLNKLLTSSGFHVSMTGVHTPRQVFLLSQEAPTFIECSPEFFKSYGVELNDHFTNNLLKTTLLTTSFDDSIFDGPFSHWQASKCQPDFY